MYALCLGQGCNALVIDEILCQDCERVQARDQVQVTGVTPRGYRFTYGALEFSTFLAHVDPFQTATDGFHSPAHVGFTARRVGEGVDVEPSWSDFPQ